MNFGEAFDHVIERITKYRINLWLTVFLTLWYLRQITKAFDKALERQWA